MGEKEKQQIETYSYSKLDTYDNCPFQYKLKYIDKHFTFVKSLALELGTLIHYVNQNIAQLLINGNPIDYDFWKNEIYNINKPNTETNPYKSNAVKGINILEEEYFKDFVTRSEKSDLTYNQKINNYISHLQKIELMHKEDDWKILGTEIPFEYIYQGKKIRGSIDRVDINIKTSDIRVIDYKTKDTPYKYEELTTPMQFVIYAIACVELYKKYPTEFIYDLSFLDLEQKGGTKGFIDRGIKKLNNIISGIDAKNFKPKPSPMCYWCDFCKNNKNASEETKNLCPYYSLWTPSNKTFGVNKKYEENENTIAEQLDNNSKITVKKITAQDINLDEEDF